MHKAKGLEFENVMILPSFLDMRQGQNFEDSCREEERLLFVAATRAKDKLYHFIWEREQKILRREVFTFNREIGCPMEPDLSNLYISSFGRRNAQIFILNELRVGQEIIFKILHDERTNWTYRVAYVDNQRLGLLNTRNKSKMNERFNENEVRSYYVTGIHKHSCAEILKSDEKNGTTFYNQLDNFTKQQGFVLLPLFAGFGKSIQ